MTMSDQIIAVLDNLCTKFGIAIDWTSENVLPYVMELAGKFIKYEIVTSIVWCVVISVLLFVAFKAYKWFHTKHKEYTLDTGLEIADMAFAIILSAMIIAAIFTIPKEIFDIVTCITFPEKAIFEYIKPMIQK